MKDADQIAAEAAEHVMNYCESYHLTIEDVTAIIKAAIEKAYVAGHELGVRQVVEKQRIEKATKEQNDILRKIQRARKATSSSKLKFPISFHGAAHASEPDTKRRAKILGSDLPLSEKVDALIADDRAAHASEACDPYLMEYRRSEEIKAEADTKRLDWWFAQFRKMEIYVDRQQLDEAMKNEKAPDLRDAKS